MKYVIVHFVWWDPEESIAAAMVLYRDPTVKVVGQFNDGRGIAIVFRLDDEETPAR
ncbi:MAG: hypothetical protein M3541_13420 [Acidobacteriota bacterium]|nr:hypothetical protein [Acidobacteriota bacterium]MDQ3419757.1 hypothetical protein [Acidobacteriota bacterium]